MFSIYKVLLLSVCLCGEVSGVTQHSSSRLRYCGGALHRTHDFVVPVEFAQITTFIDIFATEIGLTHFDLAFAPDGSLWA